MSNYLVAEAAVRELHARYADAVWRKDFDAFGNCFAPDCEWRIAGMVLRGRAEIVETFKPIADRFTRILMTFRPAILEVREGRASGRTYITEQNVMTDGRTRAAIGTYFEHFEANQDQWRFSWRLFQTHYAGAPDMSAPFVDNPDYGPPPAMPPRDAIPPAPQATIMN